jgi:FHA domain
MPQLIASVEGVEIKQVYLHQDRTSLGRRPNNDIILSDLAVSGNHCVFELKGLADVYVEDLGSTNGTYINGKMVRRQLLQDGDVMSIGKFKIQYLSANELMDEIKTAAMPLESSDAGLHASLKVLSGSSAGLEMPVVKAVTTFGKPGVAVVAIAHRRHGYFVSLVDGVQTPTVNGAPVNADGIQLRHQDVLDLAGTQMLFVLN